MTFEAIVAALRCPKPTCVCHRRHDISAKVHCPVHHDEKPSLSVATGNGKILVRCQVGCSQRDVIAALRERDLWPQQKASKRQIVATYPYRDFEGKLLYEVVRFEPKEFRQRRPNGHGGWIWNLNGVRPVLYRLPELLATDLRTPVYIVEGEKDVDRLKAHGIAATTHPMGAGKWREEFAEHFRGRDVVIVPDNDEPGRRHVQQIAGSLYGVAARVKIVELPDLPPKGDVSDWLDAGGKPEDIIRLADGTPAWEPNQQQAVPLDGGGFTLPVSEERPSQATVLVQLVEARGAELFRDPDLVAYLTVEVGGHRETWPVRSRSCRLWLGRLFYEAEEKAPSSHAVEDALDTLEGRAMFEGKEHRVFVRVGEHAGNIYLDLCDPEWQAVEIAPTGWQVIANPPVKFRRPHATAALPVPTSDGKLGELRRFTNVLDDRHWTLLAAWLLAGVNPHGPYPVLVLHGEQGSAKSTTARVLRALIDPSTVPLRSEPREPRDLMIAAKHSWVIAYDNLSHLTPWLSDAICRISTGGGFGTRQLYSDEDEILFDAMRPVILNGIEELATRPDLLDRALILRLPPIPDDHRRPETEFWQDFEAVRPAILGGLLDAVVGALACMAQVKLSGSPRMADFARWITAAEPALGLSAGTFLRAYTGSREAANELALESSPVAPLIDPLLMRTNDEWTGSAQDLLKKLEEMAGEKSVRQKSWPKTPRALRGALERIAPNLRAIGIEISFKRSKSRVIALRRIGDPTDATDGTDGNPDETGPFSTDGTADGPEATGATDVVTDAAGNSVESGITDRTDGTDGYSPTIPSLRSDDPSRISNTGGGDGEVRRLPRAAGGDEGRRIYLRGLAESWGWPRIYIGWGESVGSSREIWAQFLSTAEDDRVGWAIADLESLEGGRS